MDGSDHPPLTAEQIAKLERLHREATPKEWDRTCRRCGLPVSPGACAPPPFVFHDKPADCLLYAKPFIAAVRNALPALIAAARERDEMAHAVVVMKRERDAVIADAEGFVQGQLGEARSLLDLANVQLGAVTIERDRLRARVDAGDDAVSLLEFECHQHNETRGYRQYAEQQVVELRARVERLETALREIEALPSKWMTIDQSSRNAQVGMWAPGIARAALDDGGKGE